MADLIDVGRLALRREGKWWVAYYAKTHTMANALPLGRILMRLVEGPGREACKAAFMKTMTDAVDDMIYEATGVRPEGFKAQPAPEHERSGTA